MASLKKGFLLPKPGGGAERYFRPPTFKSGGADRPPAPTPMSYDVVTLNGERIKCVFNLQHHDVSSGDPDTYSPDAACRGVGAT